ncbi:MAG: DUF3368 domain-containing protein [Chloroflexi bacterium]|nr:DUF3368 domain-containing protein [Chloroflexota bacterium]
MAEVVSNTGPLIALASIGQLDLLRALFGRVHIPPAVRDEIQDDVSVTALRSATWLIVNPVNDILAVQLLTEALDAGESEALILAKELAADWVLIDERAATRRARSIGLRAIGTLGVLLLAKRQGLIAGLQPLLNDLRAAGFHMSDLLYQQVLASAGED